MKIKTTSQEKDKSSYNRNYNCFCNRKSGFIIFLLKETKTCRDLIHNPSLLFLMIHPDYLPVFILQELQELFSIMY